MSRYLNRKTRDAVAKRARLRCEYCLLHEDDAYLSFEIDHIISLKHGGNNELDNLAYSCVACNRMKGADIGSVVLPEKEFIRQTLCAAVILLSSSVSAVPASWSSYGLRLEGSK